MISSLFKRINLDPYLIALVATVAVASLAPVTGAGKQALDVVVTIAIACLFFLYGARLSPAAVWSGIMHWRLQSLIFLTTFVAFPLAGLALTFALSSYLDPLLVRGLMFTCILPSTVQSSIAFTSIARGNVPAALCSASLSNLAGIIVTPVLLSLLENLSSSGMSLAAVKDIALQILVPFLIGQCARPWIGGWIQRHRQVTSLFDRGSILLVVYSAFSAGMAAGIWSKLTPLNLLWIAAADGLLLAAVITYTTVVSRLLRFNQEDEIAIVFCGSKKSIASGIPMANILFPMKSVGLIVLPLMIFHQLQLFVCAVLARRYARRPGTPDEGDSARAPLRRDEATT